LGLPFINAHVVVEWLRRRWDDATMRSRMTGHAPKTEDRAELVDLSRSDVEAWIFDLVNAPDTTPFHLDRFFTSQTVMDKLESAVRVGGYGLPRNTFVPSAKSLGRMLSRLGCEPMNKRQPVPMPDGTVRRVWSKPYDADAKRYNDKDLINFFAGSSKA